MARTRLLVIGNGMAGVRFLEELLALDAGRFEITVVGAEPAPGYNRVLLSAFLANDVGRDALTFHDTAWYRDNSIDLVTGHSVRGLDAAARRATLDDGRHLDFDACVLATGSRAVRLPMPGHKLDGVLTFRDLGDCAALEAAALAEKAVAVIGGGLLGIEAAYGLAKRGARVTLVHVMDRLMERQLDARAAVLVRRALERKGVRVLLDTQTKAVLGTAAPGTSRARALQFADGGELACDMAVMAVGIAPNAELAARAGIGVDRGILVDDAMATTVPGFYAIGECAEHGRKVHGLVEPAYAQAKVLARALTGDEKAAFPGFTPSTNLKVSGIGVFSAGNFLGGEGCECIAFEDRAARVYKRLVIKDDRLVGAILVGDTGDGLRLRALIDAGTRLGASRATLAFGSPAQAAASLAAAA